LSASSFIPPLAVELFKLGDARVSTLACVGAEGGKCVRSVLGGKKGLLPDSGGCALAVIDERALSDSALGVAASDVVVLEVRQADLINDSPHGVRLLTPLLQRALQQHALKPQKKMLMLVITDADSDEASEPELHQLASEALDCTWRSLRKPAELGIAAVNELFELSLVTVPPALAAAEHASSLASLKERFASPDSTRYLFTEGQFTCSASTARLCLAKLSKLDGFSSQAVAPPAEVATAHACSLIAESVARAFSKELTVLKKDSEPAYLPDFGERATILFDDALGQFDASVVDLHGVPAVASARKALRSQLLRSMYILYRKQLTHLQRQTLTKFGQKLAAMQPSANVEVELRNLIKEIRGSLELEAKRLLLVGTAWSYTYEKEAVLSAIEEQAANHVETLRVQGLYLPKSGRKVPVDLSAHWLLMHPFGQDARYDTISTKDKAKIKPQAQPMLVRATEGYKARLRDPKDMVFSDKMP
jgi:hypothetical protein